MSMEFETININDIKPADYNPRIMNESERRKLEKGLSTFGLVDPIIIDLKHNNTIISGHQRIEVLKEKHPDLNMKLLRMGDIGLLFNETEFQLKDLNDQKSLNLALNSITGDWDYNKRDSLLEELQEAHYDIELTGFEEDVLEDIIDFETTTQLLKQLEEENKPSDEENNNNILNDTAEAKTVHEQIETNIKQGDLYQLGKHRLYCGDSTKEESYKTLLGEQRADITFTSPPYNAQQNMQNNPLNSNPQYNVLYTPKTDTNKGTSYINFKDNLNDEEYSALLIESAKNCLNYSDDILFNIGILRGSKKGIINLLHELQDNFLDVIIWDKGRSLPLGLKTQQKMISHKAELIFCFNQEGNRSFTHAQWKQGTKHNIITVQRDTTNKYAHLHQATYPQLLAKEIIHDFTENSILDPFGGTGTTLLAAEEENKTCYMIELEPKYCQLIINRFEEETGRKAKKIN